MRIYRVTPVPKPRMTQRDRWKKRPCVVRYHEFKDRVRALKLEVFSGEHVIFIMPMPKSWSEKARKRMNLTPHTARPDKDNLEKALLDALYKDDSGIWDLRVTKLWGYNGRILVTESPRFTLPGDFDLL